MLAKLTLIMFAIPVCLAVILLIVTAVCMWKDKDIPDYEEDDE